MIIHILTSKIFYDVLDNKNKLFINITPNVRGQKNLCSYVFTMIIALSYKETLTSYDILGRPRTPRTSQDLLGISIVFI